MSGRGFISEEKKQKCDFCGKIAVLRPYGPNNEAICFTCAMKDEAKASKIHYGEFARLNEV